VSRDPQSLTKAFITYVRPLLEYNSIIWSPYIKQDVDRIEQVQRRFSNRLRGLRTYTYENRLKSIDLPSLELRRLRNDLAWCYRIVFGLTVLKFSEFFDWSPATRTARTGDLIVFFFYSVMNEIKDYNCQNVSGVPNVDYRCTPLE